MKSGAGSLLLAVLLAGCASSSPEAATGDNGHVVVGSGSAQDRQDIEKSDQQMYQMEHAGIPSPTAPNPPANTSPAPAAPTETPSAPADTAPAPTEPPPTAP